LEEFLENWPVKKYIDSSTVVLVAVAVATGVSQSTQLKLLNIINPDLEIV